VDTIPPQVVVNSPVSGSFFTEVEVMLSGEIIDATAVSLSINGQAVPPENINGNQFNHPFTLEQGENNLTISAVDAANHSSQTSLTLFLDSINPQITVSSPQSGSVTNQDKITITGSIVDAYPHQVTLSGGSAGSIEGELIGSNFYFKDILL
jgi:bacillopeptidase F